MTLSEPIARTRERLTEMTTELRSTGGKPGTYTLAVTDRVPELLDHIEALEKLMAEVFAIGMDLGNSDEPPTWRAGTRLRTLAQEALGRDAIHKLADELNEAILAGGES